MGIIQLSQIPLSRPLRKWLGNCMAEGVDGSGRSPVETTGSWRYQKHAGSAEIQHRSSSGEKLDGPQAARLAGHRWYLALQCLCHATTCLRCHTESCRHQHVVTVVLPSFHFWNRNMYCHMNSGVCDKFFEAGFVEV